MLLFNFFKKSNRLIDLSNDKVEKLIKLADDLGDTLIEAGFGFYVPHLSQIRLAAERHDTETFKRQVISRELFDGAGAMWEIWIQDNQLRAKFEKRFCDFVDLLKEMGIRNGRINQVRKSFR